MNDLELIESHMREKFLSPDPFVMRRLRALEAENADLLHRIKCLRNETRGLYAKIELLREQQGDRDPHGE